MSAITRMIVLLTSVTCAKLSFAFHLASPIISSAFSATNTGRYKKVPLCSGPNDEQGDIPKILDDNDVLFQFIPLEYLKDLWHPSLRNLTAGVLREDEYLRKYAQRLVMCDLEIWAEKRIFVPLPPEKNPFEIVRKIVEEDKNLPFVLSEFRGDFIGNTEIVEQVASRVNETLQSEELENQESFAFVHTGPNGVGKTFTAMCLPELLQNSTTFAEVDIRFVYAYTGFNVNMELTRLEVLFIKGDNVKDPRILEERICRVVLSRFILVLNMMIKYNKIYETNYFHAQPMMPIEIENETPYDDCLKLLHELDSVHLKMEFNSLCAKLTEVIGRTTVIVINVDEAHFLDKLVEVEGKPQGARFALRVLRQMQARVFDNQNGTCLLLPIASGINPATSLSSWSQGVNVGVYSSVVSEDDFKEIVDKRYTDLNEQERILLADLMYPRIPDLKQSSGIIPAISSPDECNYQDTKDILVAGLGGPEVQRSIIPQLVATRDSGRDYCVPVLDAPVWSWLCLQFKRHGVELEPPVDTLFNVLEFRETPSRWFRFEEAALEILAEMLNWLGKLELEATDLRNYKYIELSAFLEVFNHNVGFKGKTPCKSIMPKDSTKCSQPFTAEKSHADTLTNKNSTLIFDFVDAIYELKVGGSFLYSCGVSGSTMVDYILVHKRAEATGDTNGELVLRYGNCNYSENSENPNSVPNTKINELKDKASKLHEAITARARDGFNSSTDLKYNVRPEYKVFLVTNVDQEHEGITVLSPKTFHFRPWTTMLFGRPYSSKSS